MTDLLGNSNDDIDFDAAASAFPDISLDGEGDIPALPATTGVGAAAPEGFDDFEFGGGDIGREVKVTGDSDDEIEKFEDQFPDIGPVEVRSVLSLGQYTSAFWMGGRVDRLLHAGANVGLFGTYSRSLRCSSLCLVLRAQIRRSRLAHNSPLLRRHLC